MIAIPIIATAKYISFVPNLVEGINRYFLPKHKKTIFVFTDFKGDIKGVEKVYQEHKPWPFSTLYRYHIIYNYFQSQQLNFDYYYYIDSDSRVVDTVGDEILGKIVATRHPGFYNKNATQFELSPKFLTQSYVNPNLLKYYYCGGFNGGSEYLNMAKTIKEWVDIDQKYGFTPRWHDESYLQKYLLINPPDVILTPEYMMPETMRERRVYQIDYMKPKMIAITK